MPKVERKYHREYSMMKLIEILESHFGSDGVQDAIASYAVTDDIEITSTDESEIEVEYSSERDHLRVILTEQVEEEEDEDEDEPDDLDDNEKGEG